MSENMFVTKSGVELELQAAPEVGLQTLLFGFVNDFKLPRSGAAPEQVNEMIQKHFSKSKDFSVQKQTLRLINYVAAFGVKTTPPESAAEELEVLGLEVGTPLVLKRNWLLMLVLDNEDIPELIERVIALTYGNNSNEPEDNPGS